MAVFTLASFASWVKGENDPEHQFLWQVLAAILYAGGCLSKETALFLPIAIVAYDFFFIREQRNRSGILSSTVRAWPLWIVAAAYLAVRAVILRGLVHSEGIPLSLDILTIPTIMWGYMRRLIWPVQLAISYHTPPVTSVTQWRFWLPMLAWIIACVLAWRIAKRSRVVAFSLLWVFTFLSPAIIGLPSFPLDEWIHDRYLYLPSFGLCLLLVHAIALLPSERKFSGIPAIPALTILVLTATMALGLSWQQQYWANGYLLFRHSTALQPNTALNKAHLATEFLRRGDMLDARRLFQEALVLEPDNWPNNFAYGLFLFSANDFANAEKQFTQCIRLSAANPNQFFYLGMSRLNLGNFVGAQKAFEMAVQKDPARVGYHFWLGVALEKQGRLADARQQYETELQEHPDQASPAALRLKALALH
jgi:Tfp pilus assembly protein PilF